MKVITATPAGLNPDGCPDVLDFVRWVPVYLAVNITAHEVILLHRETGKCSSLEDAHFRNTPDGTVSAMLPVETLLVALPLGMPLVQFGEQATHSCGPFGHLHVPFLSGILDPGVKTRLTS